MVLLALLLAAHGFGWPLRGVPVVERPFTPPVTAYGAGHRGVDLQAAVGDPVLAAGEGVVSYVGMLAGRGVIALTHPNGLRTTYEPVTSSVRLGTRVAKGAVLGRVAAGHASCRGPTCLHWGLLRGSTYLDPLALLQKARIVLLPVTGAPSSPASVTASGAAVGGGAAAAVGLLGYQQASRRGRRRQDAS